MNYWLLKSEPETYSWEDLTKEKIGTWDGVRNYAARLHLRQMKLGDLCFFYYSVSIKSIIGIVEVVDEAFQDPTDDTGIWSAIRVKPVKLLDHPISLQKLKENPFFEKMILLNNTRLSVQPVSDIEFNEILKLSKFR
ncbi:MAG: EVE domain-containing protein [Saprospiraceae bacterium]|nr:EVE domain-containing protein [Saprospiraceae bacterium]